jgi:arginine-tRNA-protein transferase
MVIELYTPRSLSPARLDKYLASGWFRAGTLLYRSEIACLELGVWGVINIRLALKNFTFKKRWRKLLKQNENKFHYQISKIKLTARHQELYEFHKKRCRGVITPELHDYFYGQSWKEDSVFDTYQIDVFEGEKLVAASFFDIGEVSLVSIVGLYDDAYRPYSMGNYTMLLEILYAQKLQKKYYYPGYSLKGCNLFDYKLDLGEMQYYSWQGRWKSWKNLSQEVYLADIYVEKTREFLHELQALGIECEEKLYIMYGINFPNQTCAIAPILIVEKNNEHKTSFWIIEYLYKSNSYRLGEVYRCYNANYLIFAPDMRENPLYCLQTLCFEKVWEVGNKTQIIKKLKSNIHQTNDAVIYTQN